ncbi:2-phosphosulfolactate phosphatase [Nocardioides sp. R-C-SC26]|uniref:2-phosphosulfolactate phosphatase n=1 Tax=Nocardioides sp. R-C-SC26 TaxID=2870414 RepID=UPI001E440067|nr:2-phosphosulfolactate phosphatase [Nocardioides sp. R-C-SC26]
MARDFDAAHRQSGYDVALEWGPTGADAITGGDASRSDVVAVVVDVLSFTTTATVALGRGIEVVPCRWRDERAEETAERFDAVLAVGRFEQRRSGIGVSLSPAAMASVDGVDRVVLPSPNGSTICARLAESGVEVVLASLLNAPAVGAYLAGRMTSGARVRVVPAGERWPDGGLRPAVEDLWGAGAVIEALVTALPETAGSLSPEADLARTAFGAVRPDLSAALLSCASGRELVDNGFAEDVDVAAGWGSSNVVPTLRDGVFVDAPREGRS